MASRGGREVVGRRLARSKSLPSCVRQRPSPACDRERVLSVSQPDRPSRGRDGDAERRRSPAGGARPHDHRAHPHHHRDGGRRPGWRRWRLEARTPDQVRDHQRTRRISARPRTDAALETASVWPSRTCLTHLYRTLGGGNHVGLDVNRAARIGAAAHGGQVLLSSATAALVERKLPLPPRTLDARPNDLPAQTTKFTGRSGRIARIRKLLAETPIGDPDGLGRHAGGSARQPTHAGNVTAVAVGCPRVTPLFQRKPVVPMRLGSSVSSPQSSNTSHWTGV